MLDWWYFYWHNQTTGEKGVEAGLIDYYELEDHFSGYIKALPGCHWIVTSTKFETHPCQVECHCETLNADTFPEYPE